MTRTGLLLFPHSKCSKLHICQVKRIDFEKGEIEVEEGGTSHDVKNLRSRRWKEFLKKTRKGHCEKGRCLLYVAFGSRSCFDIATEILLSKSKETNQPA